MFRKKHNKIIHQIFIQRTETRFKANGTEDYCIKTKDANALL